MRNANATHGPKATYVRSRSITLPASLAIDGKVSGSWCAATLLSTSPWLRVDLKTAYLITGVEASFWLRRGNGAVVRIGSNLTNNGNDNLKCGRPISNSASGTLTRTVCSPPLWGRCINVQNIFSSQRYLSVCELRANYSKNEL